MNFAGIADTPWDEPTLSAPEFEIFIAGELLNQDPWQRISGAAMSTFLLLYGGRKIDSSL